ncbi:beta-lactamase family protein [Aureisphaera sp. CAU 1614]|uniref:Beta-lactamase family protein n=1 Tax=Halomarinibacterium sedimenti TaxID=2857106 RepID=A0A9X1JYI7_9FLAO|nr:serine hydrolase domain-containing protein [Halomarinibacterium sedimenti]MBW2937562.1 beta-lactamase family protein [Halomarinibacterium sedimenti]
MKSIKMKNRFILLFALVILSACNKKAKLGITQQPTLTDYAIGEKWVWKYKGVTTQGEVRSEGTDTREIIEVNGELNITIGKDTIPVAEMAKPEESDTPKYDWPLKVGKKWVYEENWTSQDGTTGKQQMNAEVLSYKEETVDAGTFMAYTIHYNGNITNSRGYNAVVDEVWLYAPGVKNFIKLTQKQDDFVYNEELIEYSDKPSKSKVQLENQIIGKVKFLEEPENFSTIVNKMVDYKIPALSLAVINDGKIEWADMYQNPSFSEQNLNYSSIFQAASLSKPVTFFATLRMHTAGKIDLDENIEKYLKRYKLPQGKQTAENPVTLRNIFAHTSGITSGGYQGYAKDLAIPSDIAVLKGSEGVNSPAIEVISTPNEMLAYSGGGYTLAEVALQDVFNDDFSNIMNQWILQPIGMENSEFTQPLQLSDSSEVAKGYTSNGVVLEGGWRNHPEQAAAGLWSNATDMAKFLIEIYKGYQGQSSIFSKSEIQSILNQERDGHIYGLIVDKSDSGFAITHYGGNAGYRTGMTIDLNTGKGLVYLINSDNGGALGNELLLSASQLYNWNHFKRTSAIRNQLDSELLKQLTGTYKWNSQVELSISFNDETNQISLHFPNGDTYKLVPVKGDEISFINPNTGVDIKFLKSSDFNSFILYGQKAVKLR